MTASSRPPKLSLRQKLFCEAYAANGGNGSQAAITAGYTESDAGVRSDRLLNRPHVIEYLKSLTDKIESKNIARIEEIQTFWTSILRGQVQDDGYPAKLSERIKASELLAKSQGAFIEKLQVSGANGEALPTINLTFVQPRQMSLEE